MKHKQKHWVGKGSGYLSWAWGVNDETFNSKATCWTKSGHSVGQLFGYWSRPKNNRLTSKAKTSKVIDEI